jgi:hypothetical protein
MLVCFSLADGGLNPMLQRRCHSNDVVQLNPQGWNLGIVVFVCSNAARVGSPRQFLRNYYCQQSDSGLLSSLNAWWFASLS